MAILKGSSDLKLTVVKMAVDPFYCLILHTQQQIHNKLGLFYKVFYSMSTERHFVINYPRKLVSFLTFPLLHSVTQFTGLSD